MRDRRSDELRRAGNPLYGERKLKLGTFGTNLDRGCAISTIDGVLEINWPNTLTLAKLADEMEFEALVPVGRWKGFGGVTNFNGPGFETFSWAAGVGALTQNATVFATSHVLHRASDHGGEAGDHHRPYHRRKICAQRGYGLAPAGDGDVRRQMLDHDDRYQLAVEWLEIIQRLWTAEEEFDYDGKHFKVAKGYLQPKPLQKPFPPVMNAGSSETGRDYAAKYCDIAFVNTNRGDFESNKALIESYRKHAREEYGRELQIWSTTYIVQGETEQEAKDYRDEYIHRKGDWEAATNLIETMGLNSQGRSPELLEKMKTHFIGGWGGYPLVGTKEQVVDGLAMMSRLGLDGVVVSWPRYIEDMRNFQRVTLPLLKQAGLR